MAKRSKKTSRQKNKKNQDQGSSQTYNEANPGSMANSNMAGSDQLNKDKTKNDSARTSHTISKTWVSGLVGLVSINLTMLWFYSNDVLVSNIQFFGYQITQNKNESILVALILCAASMFSTEFVCTTIIKKQSFLNFSNQDKRLFIVETISRYLSSLALLWILKVFYQSAGEYGYVKQAPFYQPWFMSLDFFWNVFLWIGLPYIFVTRLLRANDDADKYYYSVLIEQLARYAFSFIPKINIQVSRSIKDIKAIFLNLLVKLFFLPLMIVFFFQNFPALINDLAYIQQGMPNAFNSGHIILRNFNIDIARIGIHYLFSIHVALAFCAYALTSRWINTHAYSVNDTLTGWFVCLLTFPPFTHMLVIRHIGSAQIGPYLHQPSGILLQVTNQGLITLTIICMLIFYLLYLACTITLGLRYANLCNRGIINSGPYAWVRHPAYTSKLLGWLCVLFPLILLNIADNHLKTAGFLALGYGVAILLYSLRALTEEKHLQQDTAYKQYRKQVKYRFIPKLI